MRTELVIRFDYGSVDPVGASARRADAAWRSAGPTASSLRTPIDLEPDGMTHAADSPCSAGERVPFVLTWFPSHDGSPRAGRRRSTRSPTPSAFWRDWIERLRLRRASTGTPCTTSLIVLKALTYAPTGGIVAAPTTSLPERIGGVRNWDYRYCWLRDATFTLYALMNAGYIDEARAWRDWLLRAVAGDPAKAQILYGVGGQRRVARVRARLAARVRGLAAGADRQRRARAVPARRVRRGDGRAAPGARRTASIRDDHAWSLQRNADGVPRRRVGPAGRRDLGGARAAPPLHALEGARVGRVRPRRQAVERFGAARAGRALAARPRRRSTRRCCREGFNVELNSFTQAYGSDELDASTLLIPHPRLPAGRRSARRRDDRRDRSAT